MATKLQNIELRNNFIMSAVKIGYGDAEGNISGRHFAFLDKSSKHIAAVIFEPFFIDKKVRELLTQIGIDSDDKIAGHKKLIEAVHRNGAKAVAHKNHPGRMANPKLPNNIYLSASEIECPNGGPKPKELSIEEIKFVQQQYVDAAIRAKKAGYDFIKLQFVGRELEEITPATEKKNYAVVGGGIAGMQFALAIKQLGHQVKLFEKEKLGGQFNFAPLPPQKQSLQKQIDYFVDEIKDAHIEVINKEATAKDLIGKYDGVIIASGSKPFIPPIDGLKEYHWAEILYEFNLTQEKMLL